MWWAGLLVLAGPVLTSGAGEAGAARHLLQEGMEGDDVVGEDVSEAPTPSTPAPTEKFEKENQAGPTEFYHENGGLPKFLMMVDEGIEVTIFQGGAPLDTFTLDQPAKGGITASKPGHPDSQELQVDIHYKGQQFRGRNGNTITGLQLEMTFKARPTGVWFLAGLQIIGLGYAGDFITEDLAVTSSLGYKVEAPRGLAWCCLDAGTFRPPAGNTSLGPPGPQAGGPPPRAGVAFPGLRLQVFEVERGMFGPDWECGEILSIGLLTGLLVTLGFAIICFWGFSMLANINTMDRFDDPKGPSIYIPNTD